jgi:hypothetical protein
MHLRGPNNAATHRVSPYRLSREHVTHAEAIAKLLVPAPREGDAPAKTNAAVVDHVAHCSDCWQALADLDVPDAAERVEMSSHFGCDAVRDDLFALVDLDARAIARDHAGAARHLSWCHACRSRFAELVAVERELAAVPRWLEVGAQVREAVGRLVVRLGRAAAGLVEVPDAFVLGPAVAAAPVRGGEIVAASSQSARVELGDSGVWVEVENDTADAGLCLRLLGASAEPLSVRLREVRDDGEPLVARYTLGGAEPVLVRGLWPGSFVVELHDAHAVHRVRLDVGS